MKIKVKGSVLPEDRIPLKMIVQFFMLWRDSKWDKMRDVIQISWVDMIDEFGLTENLKAMFSTKPVEVELLSHRFVNNVVFDAEVKIKHQIARKVFREEVRRARVICEAKPMTPSPDGCWGLNPNSIQV